MTCDCVTALVGRERELAVLRSVFDGLLAGRAQAALVEGEPGIGKTSLVRAAVGALAAGGGPRVEIVWATAEDDAGAGGPGAPLLEALGCEPGAPDRRRAAVAALLAGGQSPGALPDLVLTEPDLRVRVREQLVQLIRELAVERPLALVVDDAHWADPTTVQVLTQLARRPGSEPVALVVVTRPEPDRADLARLFDALAEGGAPCLRPGHLDPGQMAALATDTLGARPGPRLTDALAGAAGSPFLVLELLRSLQAEGAVRRTGGDADLVDGTALPLAFRPSLRRRLGTLPRPDRALAVLRVAAVLGPTFHRGELAAVLDRPMVELAGVLDDAIGAGVLVESGRHLAFRHALLREAVYRDIPEGIRGGLHADAARGLARAGATAGRVAGHLERADRTDDEAAAWLEQAAAETVRVDPARAVELLERARARPGAVDHRPVLDLELGRALTWSGHPVEAAEVIRGVLTGPGGAAFEARARPLLAAALLLGGHVAGAVQQIDLALLGEGLSPVDRARLRAEGAFGRFVTGDLDGATRAAGRAVAEADALGDGVARCLAAGCLSWCVYARGDFARSLTLAADAVAAGAAADGDGDEAGVTGRYAPHLFLAVPLMIADRFEESAAAVATARRACEQAGRVSLLPAIHSVSALIHLLVGDWDDALAEVETGLSRADDVGSRLGLLWLHAIRAHVELHRGERARAEAAVAAAHAELDRGGPQTGVDWLLWARALLSADDDPTTAAQTLGAVWDAYESVGVIGNRTGMGPDLVRLALAAGDRDRATAVTLAVEEAARNGVGSVEVAACRCRAMLDGDTGRGARAVQLARGGPRLLQWAAACEEQAVRLRSGADGPVSGRRVQQLVDEAQEVYGRMGAAADIARLAVAVGPRRSPARPARPVSGWRSLTPTEEKVATLVAAGLSNREIGERLSISPRTVEIHIAHAFRKLDLSSRVELANGAVAHGLALPPQRDQA